MNNQPLAGQTDTLLRATQSGSYRVRVTDSQGCFDTRASISLQFLPLPTPVIQMVGNDSLCPGQNSTLRCSGMSSYQWLRNNQPIAGATDSTLQVSQPGAYRVIGTLVSGCADTSAPIQLFPGIEPQPLISVQGNTVLCAGTQTTLQLQLAAGSTFAWYRNDTLLATATGNSLQTSSPGTYYVLAQSPTQCINTSNVVNIQVNPLPTVNLQPAGAQPSFCTNDSLLLRALGQPGAYSYVLTYEGCRGSQEVVYGTVFLLR